jgi:mono/diheme cytochrome c family protein
MTTSRTSLCLAAALMLTACVNSSERERVDFERMRIQQRYEPYGSSAVFPNAQSMQQPPSGTLSQESASDTGVVGTGMIGGRPVADIPLTISPKQLVAGEQKFTIYCAVCHGDAGYGGSLVAENMGPPRVPSLRSATMLAQPAGYTFAVATNGKGRMPSFSAQLTAEERWAVVAYLQDLQQSPAVTAAQRADSARAAEIQAIDSAAAKAKQP